MHFSLLIYLEPHVSNSRKNHSRQPILKLKNVSKTFPGVLALDDVSVDFYPGEVLVLVGENGAGKSTLMKIIAGVYQPDGGEIHFEGTQVFFNNPSESSRHGIKIVYQEQALIPDMNAIDNVFINEEQTVLLHKTIFGVLDNRMMRSKTVDIIRNTFGQDIDLEIPVKELPLVHKQIIEIIRAIVNEAKVIIFDEPTAALEKNEKQHLFDFINMVKAQGVSVIYCSHYIEECVEIGDRILALRDGIKVGERRKEETSVEEIIEMMIGKSIEDQFPKLEGIASQAPVLKVKDLNKAKAFENIDLELYKGEILGLTGLAGSGKTELARSLFGIEEWDSGEISINGKNFTKPYPCSVAMQHNVAFLPADRKSEGLFLEETVLYNILLANLEGVEEPWIRKKLEIASADKYIGLLRIKTPSYYTFVRNLSGGNQQKVLIARWLFKNAKIIIFDEPTRGIDVNAKVEVYKMMGEIVKNGGAVIMVSSDLPELEGICDRVLVFHNNKIIKELKGNDLTQEKISYHSIVSNGS